MAPRVSVIIPTYNRASLISQAIDSVLAQTFKDYEIIVIDDGSTDNTQEIRKKFDGRINTICQANQGIAQTRNQGIRQAQGSYIAFLDSDDFWTPEKLQEQVKVLDQNPRVGIVYGRMPIINEKGETIGMKPAGVSGKNLKELLELWGDIPTSTVLARKACFDQAGLFDTQLESMEDIDMWIRIAEHYDLYEIEHKVLAYYRRHGQQITQNMVKVYEGLVKIFTKIQANYPQAPPKLMLRRITENQYLLAKAFYDQGSYPNAFQHAWKAILRYPLLGSYFFKKSDHAGRKIITLMKPYGLLLLSLVKS